MAGEMGMTGIGLGDAMLLAQRGMGGGYGMDGMGSMAMWNNPLAWMMMYGMMRNGGWGWDNGNGNGGCCNRGGCVTPFELNQGLNDQDLRAGIRGIQQGICDSTYALTGAITQGNTAIQHAIADCCCQTNNNIERTGCNIIQAIHGEGEATRGLILSEKIEGLRDRVNEKDRELQSAQFQLSQLSQNATLINALRPTPIPAYLAVNPYQAVGYNCNNPCGGNYGTGWAA